MPNTVVKWVKETMADRTKCGRRLADSGNSRSGANTIGGRGSPYGLVSGLG